MITVWSLHKFVWIFMYSSSRFIVSILVCVDFSLQFCIWQFMFTLMQFYIKQYLNRQNNSHSNFMTKLWLKIFSFCSSKLNYELYSCFITLTNKCAGHGILNEKVIIVDIINQPGSINSISRYWNINNLQTCSQAILVEPLNFQQLAFFSWHIQAW